MQKVLKKGKRSNREERLAAYEKILNQGEEAAGTDQRGAGSHQPVGSEQPGRRIGGSLDLAPIGVIQTTRRELQNDQLHRKYYASGWDLYRPDGLLEKQRSATTIVGTALQEIEPNLRKVRGYRHLKELREAMKAQNSKNKIINAA
jgi:hypothetical protein